MPPTLDAAAAAAQVVLSSSNAGGGSLSPIVSNVHYLWLVPFFPLLGAALNGIFGASLQARFGKRAINVVGIGVMALSALVAWTYFIRLVLAKPEDRFFYDHVFTMFEVGVFKASMSFSMDPLTAMMMLIITTIGT